MGVFDCCSVVVTDYSTYGRSLKDAVFDCQVFHGSVLDKAENADSVCSMGHVVPVRHTDAFNGVPVSIKEPLEGFVGCAIGIEEAYRGVVVPGFILCDVGVV